MVRNMLQFSYTRKTIIKDIEKFKRNLRDEIFDKIESIKISEAKLEADKIQKIYYLNERFKIINYFGIEKRPTILNISTIVSIFSFFIYFFGVFLTDISLILKIFLVIILPSVLLIIGIAYFQNNK